MAKPELTKRYIAETFRILVKQNDYSAITVQRIIETCEINRKTFYYHFFNKADLATYIFRNDLASRLRESVDDELLVCDSGAPDDKYHALPCYYKGETLERHIQFFWILSNYIKTEVDFYRKIYRSGDWSYFNNYVFSVYHPIIEHTIRHMLSERHSSIPEEEIDYLSSYFTNSSVIWVINRHVTNQSHYSDATKRELGSLIFDAMNGAVDARCSRIPQ